MKLENLKICIVGLGYVGLPLAAAFAKKFNVIGFDIDSSRIQDLTGGIDITGELSDHELKNVDNLSFTSNINNVITPLFFILWQDIEFRKS